jgi:hypothetical protein
MKIPKGYRFGGVACGLKPSRRDLALVVSDHPAAAAGVFTRNKAAAAPIQDARPRVPAEGMRAIVANSGNANALTGPARHPQGANDAAIEREFRLVIIDGAAECKAQEAAFGDGAPPQVHTDERLGMEAPCGFLAGFADHRLEERLAIFEMARRLVQDQAVAEVFFDHEKAAIHLDDGGNGDFRIPAHG